MEFDVTAAVAATLFTIRLLVTVRLFSTVTSELNIAAGVIVIAELSALSINVVKIFPVTLPKRLEVIRFARKLPLPSRETIVPPVLALVAVVAELETLPAVLIVDNFVSAILPANMVLVTVPVSVIYTPLVTEVALPVKLPVNPPAAVTALVAALTMIVLSSPMIFPL